MPIVTIKLLAGRSDEQKRELVDSVTTAVSASANAPKERIHVIIEEMQPENYGVAGIRKSDEV
ncbi:MAG: 2-hydroxymuconate tautomerase [Culicoidibacterales bacterium]